MTRAAEVLAARLARARARGRAIALVFDFDGTLSPIAPHPRAARFPVATRRALRDLSRLPGVLVGVVSGRPLPDLRRKVRLPGVRLAGGSGLEMDRWGKKGRPRPGVRSLRALAGATAALEVVAGAFPGAWVERKPFGASLHYRQVEPRHRSRVRRRALRVLAAHRGHLLVSRGPLALEATLDLGMDKGSAIREFLRGAGPDSLVLFAGDSGNDESAFREVRRRRGIALGVGPEPAGARRRIRDPAALGSFLARLLRALRSRGRAA